MLYLRSHGKILMKTNQSNDEEMGSEQVPYILPHKQITKICHLATLDKASKNSSPTENNLLFTGLESTTFKTYGSLIYFDSLSKIDVDHIQNESTRVGETLRKSAGEVQWFFLRHHFYAASCVPMQSEGRNSFLNLIFFKTISGSVSNMIPKKL